MITAADRARLRDIESAQVQIFRQFIGAEGNQAGFIQALISLKQEQDAITGYEPLRFARRKGREQSKYPDELVWYVISTSNVFAQAIPQPPVVPLEAVATEQLTAEELQKRRRAEYFQPGRA